MALGNILKEFGVKISMVLDKKKVEEAKKAVDQMGKDMRSLAITVSAASAAVFEFANIASSNSRELQQNADMLGINVERLQELEYAAKVAANVSRGELMGALEGVSSTLDKARHSDVMAAESLIRLGVPLEMISNRAVTADQVMLLLADRLKGIQDPMAKARLATEVFGGAGAKLLPLLNKGAMGIAMMGKEARSMGLILNKAAVDQGAEFDRQFTKIWLVMKNITYLIGNDLIKYLRPMVTEFQRWIVINRQFIASGIASVVKSLGEYLQIVFKTVKFVADRFQGLLTVLGGAGKAAHILAIGLGIITAARIIGAVGTMVKSFQALAAILGVVNIESAAIGVGMLALILVIQDLFSKDSIIKEWIGVFSNQFPNATKFAVGVFNILKTAVTDTMEAFQGLFGWITKGMDALLGFAGAADKMLGISGAVKDAVGAFGSVGNTIGKGLGAVGDFFTAHSTAAPSAGAAAGAGPNQQNHFEVHQTVQVPPGTSAEHASKIVGGSLDDGFKAVLRHTRNQKIGGRAY